MMQGSHASASPWVRISEQPPGTIRQISPYDGDARSGTKRDSHWDGYKVHLTETCDADAPHLIQRRCV